MQDSLATIQLWTLSDSDAPAASGFLTWPKLKSALWHTVGAILLAVAMMAQPVATAVQFHASTPTSSHRSLTASALPATGAPTQSQYFAPTGKTVAGDFLSTYQKFGLSR